MVKNKAKNMRNNAKYREYTQNWLKDPEVTDIARAFRIGAVDAMILDTAGEMGIRAYVKYEYRKNLIRECISEGIIPPT